jgi:copper chaperone CopZ
VRRTLNLAAAREANMKQKLTIHGMHCAGCKMLITETLEDAGATNVQVTVDMKKNQGTAEFDSTKSKAELKKLIEAEGPYTVQ